MNTKKNVFKSVLFCGAVTALLATSAAHADNQQQMAYIGALVGANIPTSGDSANGSSSSVTGGLEVGAKLTPNFGIGGWATYYQQSNSGTFLGVNAGTGTHTYDAAGEVNIYASAFHLGGDIGESFTTWSASLGSASASTSNNTMIYGPEIGVDLPLGPVSLGAEAHYLFNNANNSNNNLLALASLKLWF